MTANIIVSCQYFIFWCVWEQQKKKDYVENFQLYVFSHVVGFLTDLWMWQ